MLVCLSRCALATPALTAPRPLDLPPPTSGAAVAVLGSARPVVERLVDDWRAALRGRDVAALRALVAPTVGRVTSPGPGMSREAWLAYADGIFASAGRAEPWLSGRPTIVSYDECAPRCPGAMLGPGEWLVRWPDGSTRRLRPGMPSDVVLPTALRVAVADGLAMVVGVNDEIAGPLGPSSDRLSGALRP
jgi:hypothetical protein